MRLSPCVLATAAIAVALNLPIGAAIAAQPPRVEGGDCGALVARLGPGKVWQTNFRGEKPSPLDLHHSDYWPYAASPCFASLSACKAWLYWAQSDYPHQNTFTPCRRLGP